MATHRSWIIGRAADCDLVVEETAVSSRHCRLSRSESGFTLEDLQSSNGTFVNGVKVTGKTRVQRGDQVTLGRTVAMPWPDSAAEAAQAEAPPAATVAVDAQRQPGAIRIGRANDNDIVLDYASVSAHHARIILGSPLRIEDLGSTNGTALGRPDAKIANPVPLSRDDVVYFGSLRMPAARLLSGHVATPPRLVAFQGKSIVFGRDPLCEQPLDSPTISWQHARLSGTPDNMTIFDLGSTNGTYVNGQRVHGPTRVRAGDVIGLGTFSFELAADGTLQKRDAQGNVTIEIYEVSVNVPDKRLLDKVSLTIFPSEFVGLMGPSGAGKTTLMNAANGYTPPSSGEVLLNGKSLYDYYDQFCNHLGYVPQDDIIHRDLTVGQALYFTARLRLPADFSQADIQTRIGNILKQLGLGAVQNVLIGSPEKKGISGGQRKRVNLAMELLTDPLVLFLDEPTSGLSSEDALMVMKVLRALADDGKTILLTIHQPSLEAYRLMDNLVVISKDEGTADPGVLAYYGPAYPDAVQFFNPDGIANAKPGVEPSPNEVLKGLKEQKTATWTTRFRQSSYQRTYVDERAGKQLHRGNRLASPHKERLFDFRQWRTLLGRCLAIKLRDTWNSAILMLQAPIVALLVVFVFGKQHLDAKMPYPEWSQTARSVGITMFLLTLSALWFGCSNAVREIVGEWAIYHRERMVNLKIPSYVASKFAALGGLCVLQCAVLLGIIHWGCELEGSWPWMFGMLLLVSFVGVSIGLTLSAVAKTSEVAIALLPIILLPMVILGGMMRPVHDMPLAMRVICYVVPSRWGFEGMLLLENDSRPRSPPVPIVPPPRPVGTGREPPEGPKTSPAKDLAEDFFPHPDRRLGIGISTLALASLGIVCTGMIHLILRARDVH